MGNYCGCKAFSACRFFSDLTSILEGDDDVDWRGATLTVSKRSSLCADLVVQVTFCVTRRRRRCLRCIGWKLRFASLHASRKRTLRMLSSVTLPLSTGQTFSYAFTQSVGEKAMRRFKALSSSHFLSHITSSKQVVFCDILKRYIFSPLFQCNIKGLFLHYWTVFTRQPKQKKPMYYLNINEW